jgi:hypothetical protein
MQVQLFQPRLGAEAATPPPPKREQQFVFGRTVTYVVLGLGVIYLIWWFPRAWKEIR